ncbi:hypothetical protein CDL15_Pgr013274 [Punica granatum]|uniref:Uncharacterized protein n=1 Tax=Punica granatum TaxID=22663 RepID=A0A218WPS8_PUNGR|nr:hypothetical protein CDL15_Pgr013274 [Punica granatum]
MGRSPSVRSSGGGWCWRRRSAASGGSGCWTPRRRREKDRVRGLSTAWVTPAPIWALLMAGTVGIKAISQFSGVVPIGQRFAKFSQF